MEPFEVPSILRSMSKILVAMSSIVFMISGIIVGFYADGATQVGSLILTNPYNKAMVLSCCLAGLSFLFCSIMLLTTKPEKEDC